MYCRNGKRDFLLITFKAHGFSLHETPRVEMIFFPLFSLQINSISCQIESNEFYVKTLKTCSRTKHQPELLLFLLLICLGALRSFFWHSLRREMRMPISLINLLMVKRKLILKYIFFLVVVDGVDFRLESKWNTDYAIHNNASNHRWNFLFFAFRYILIKKKKRI